jgi:hypothetical protein
VVTFTSTVPDGSTGLTADICVSDTTWKEEAATLPKFTAVAPVKFVPVIVTLLLPARGPEFGLTAVTAGAEINT